jgi:hypothetical protein
VLDAVFGDVERIDRNGDAVELCQEAGLSVDRSLQDRHVESRTGTFGEEVGDLFSAFDWA